MEQKLQIRGSSSSFMQDGQVLSKYSTGCFRKQLISSYGIETDFPELIAGVGALNEEFYEARLKDAGIIYEREIEIKQFVLEPVWFTGHIDFWCPNEEIKIRELKSATSPKTLSEVIKKGHYKIENLAQLVSYMIAQEVYSGILRYTYYEVTDVLIAEGPSREFIVTIDDDGRILVDGEDSKFTVADSLKHRYNSAMWLLDPEMPPPPKGHLDKWASPCKYCDFKRACNMYDCRMLRTKEEFINEAAKGAK